VKEEIKLVSRPHRSEAKAPAFLSETALRRVQAFHRSYRGYQVTPLAHLKETAALLGLWDIYVKDESCRFGLNAFKALGGSYAIGSLLAGKLGIAHADWQTLCAPETRKTGKNTHLHHRHRRQSRTRCRMDRCTVRCQSGAAAFGCAAEIMTNPAYTSIRDALGLGASSRVLFFSTEGATDTENYRAVVWDGRHVCPAYE